MGEPEWVCDRSWRVDAGSRPYGTRESKQISRGQYPALSEREALDQDHAVRRQHTENFLRHKFWVRGYLVSTVGVDDPMVNPYIRNQEREDKPPDDLFDR